MPLPDKLCGYRLLQPLSLGGLAHVVLAKNQQNQFFALKILPLSEATSDHYIALFLNEMDVVVRLAHPNIVRFAEVGVSQKKLFIAMEYVAGCNLEHLLLRSARLKRRMPVAAALYITRELLRALDYLHTLCDWPLQRPLHLVHRDINPSNVVITPAGNIKLIDFGVAWGNTAGQKALRPHIAGTCGYFAPEQCQNSQVDGRADVYAVGVTLYEMLSGQPLMMGQSIGQHLSMHRHGVLANWQGLGEQVPPEVKALLTDALHEKPKQRLASSAVMLARVNQLLGVPGEAAARHELQILCRQLYPNRRTDMVPATTAVYMPRPPPPKWVARCPRYACHYPVVLQAGHRGVRAQLINVSQSGALLACGVLPPLGTRVRLRFHRLPAPLLSFGLEAVVVRTEMLRYQQQVQLLLAIAFDANPHALRKLQPLLVTLAQQHAKLSLWQRWWHKVLSLWG